ncbi:MAG: hypothetical protein R3C32_06170 [Chloroflexota bacterium]
MPAGSAPEMAPVTVRTAKGRETVVTTDEGPRRDTALNAPRRLRPVFFDLPGDDDRGDATEGTVTAGNAPGITDGAAATVVASEQVVERLGLRPLARIVGYARKRARARWLFLYPSRASVGCWNGSTCPLDAFDLIEVNEAFAAQTLAGQARAERGLGRQVASTAGPSRWATSRRERRPDIGRCSTSWRDAMAASGWPRSAPRRRRQRRDGGGTGTLTRLCPPSSSTPPTSSPVTTRPDRPRGHLCHLLVDFYPGPRSGSSEPNGAGKSSLLRIMPGSTTATPARRA